MTGFNLKIILLINQSFSYMDKKARIRIYSLERNGLSFSYATENKMIVVGGRFDEKNQIGLKYEMDLLGFNYVDALIIPSWDPFYCKPSELNNLLEFLKPDYVIYTDRQPANDSEKKSYDYVQNYCDGEAFLTNSPLFADVHPGILVYDECMPYLLYLNFGNVTVSFIEDYTDVNQIQLINDFFKDKKTDVLIGGKFFINDDGFRPLLESLHAYKVIGRINPKEPTEVDSNMLHVEKEDIFISNVGNEIVCLKLPSCENGNGQCL